MDTLQLGPWTFTPADFSINDGTARKELEPLLEEVGADSIVIEGNTNCSLYLPVWGYGFAGDSNEMGLRFQPEQLYPFNPAIHLKENRDMKTDIRFTKALANGWFIDYKFD